MRFLLCLSVVALVGGSAAAQSPNQANANPETDPLDAAMAALALEKTPQELWKDQIYDQKSQIRQLTQKEQAKILAEAKAKSENLHISAIERRKWDDAYREAKWDIEYDSIDILNILTEGELLTEKTLVESLLEEVKVNIADADGRVRRNPNDVVSQHEEFSWRLRYDAAKSSVDYLSAINSRSIWLNNFMRAKSKEEKLSLLQIAWNKSMDPAVPKNEQIEWNKLWALEYQQEYEKVAREASMPNPYDLSVSSVKAPIHTTCIRTGTDLDCDTN